MMLHGEMPSLLRSSKTSSVFGSLSVPVHRAPSTRRRSSPCGRITAASTARGASTVRQPRKENVAGEFYIDHTCIGGLLLCRARTWLHMLDMQDTAVTCNTCHQGLDSLVLSNVCEATSCFASADCDTCRWMDPATYDRVGDMSAVVRQPQTPEEREKAMQALITCPT